jgi:hypothetical protein
MGKEIREPNHFTGREHRAHLQVGLMQSAIDGAERRQSGTAGEKNMATKEIVVPAPKTKKAKAKAKFRYVQIGTVGVDSGQVMVVDPCYVLRDNNPVAKELGLVKAYNPETDSDYETACDNCYSGTNSFKIVKEKNEDGKMVVTSAEVFNPLDEMTPEIRRKLAYGTVCSTVIGDGTYPVFAVYVGDTMVGLHVSFVD